MTLQNENCKLQITEAVTAGVSGQQSAFCTLQFAMDILQWTFCLSRLRRLQ